MQEGDRVVIRDYSEAHGDHGAIWQIQDNGMILVELDGGCIWPVAGEDELAPESAGEAAAVKGNRWGERSSGTRLSEATRDW